MQPDFIYDGDSIGVGIMMKQADIYIYIYIYIYIFVFLPIENMHVIKVYYICVEIQH
jgi:hypothetical protein